MGGSVPRDSALVHHLGNSRFASRGDGPANAPNPTPPRTPARTQEEREQGRAEKHRKEADSAEVQRSHSGLPCVQRSKDREYASESKILVTLDHFSSFLMNFWLVYFDITQKMMKIMKNDEIHQEVFLATFLARSPPIARRRRFYPHIDIVKNCHVPTWLLR